MAREGTIWMSVRLLTTIVSTNILNVWVYNDIKKAGKQTHYSPVKGNESSICPIFPIRTTALGSWGNVPLYRVSPAVN